MTNTVTIAFEHRDVVDRWDFIQSYANQFSLVIEWNGEMLVVKGDSLDAGKLVDDLAKVIYPDYQESDFYWNNFWNCEIEIGSTVYRLGIEAGKDEEPSSLQRYRAVASQHLSKAMPELRELSTEHIYPIYVEKYSGDQSSSRSEFKEALQVDGQIIYSPAHDRYELYFSATPLIETHLINVCEERGVVYPPRLEWA